MEKEKFSWDVLGRTRTEENPSIIADEVADFLSKLRMEEEALVVAKAFILLKTKPWLSISEVLKLTLEEWG